MVVIVRTDFSIVSVTKALAWIQDDWARRQARTPAKVGVISCSFYLDRDEAQSIRLNTLIQLEQAFNDAAQAGLLTVVAAGNDGEAIQGIDEWPAAFAGSQDYTPNDHAGRQPPWVKYMLPAGATDKEGRIMDFVSQCLYCKYRTV